MELFTQTLAVRYLLDSSALVKLVLREEGSAEVRRAFAEPRTFLVNSLCFAEVLNVLKRKWLSNKPGDKINDDQYFGGCLVLTSFIRGKRITIEDSMLDQIPVFERAKDICLRHKIDIADALQLVAMKEDRLRRIGAILVTADGPLEKAAKAEGVRVWNCMKGNSPPPE